MCEERTGVRMAQHPSRIPRVPQAAPTHEVLAVRYGTVTTSRAAYYLRYHAYGEPDAPMRMDYFFWVLRSERGTVLVDTGFDPAVAAARGRTCLVEPARALAALGVGAETVPLVILTHLHYDHTGNLGLFPAARLVVQARELEFWGGPAGRRYQFREHVEPGDVDLVLAADASGRVDRLDGDAVIAPGVRAVLVGGHSPGQMMLEVDTASGLVVLASDALHYYEEAERDWPCAVVVDVAAVYAGYDMVRAYEAGGARIVAGHDPLVLDRFPAAPGPLAGHAVLLR
jgi:glyoxylase-like metal-dependent hydrolase (beta-lactamase superfamily II)